MSGAFSSQVLEFRVCQYADDTTAFVKDERSLHALFNIIADFDRDRALN